jgi:autotransporter-associated beta strand protein
MASLTGRVGLFLSLGLQMVQGQVLINEFVAASSDRMLQREPGTHPRVGNTMPWQYPAYDDARWPSGPGPFGFGTFSGVTLATDLSATMKNRAASLYLRKTFTVTSDQAASGATLQLVTRYNDGFIAFLNGVEIARRNLGNPGMFAFHDQTAFNTNLNNPAPETISLGAANTRLVPGDNLLCIQAHNQALTGTAAGNFLILADLQIAGVAQLVSNQSVWKYLPGLAEPSGGVLDYGLFNAFLQDSAAVAWAARTFNDASWLVGPGLIGIEGADPPDYALGVNLYAEVNNITPSIYTRWVFAITPTEALSENALRLTLDYDDGVIVYLNGKEVARRNVGTPGIPTLHTAVAASNHDANGDNGGVTTGRTEVILIGSPKALLVSGDNVLAVQLHRVSLNDPDAIARVTLETTGVGARVLCQPTDTCSYFIGLEEPVVAGEEEDGPLAESPDSENDWIELLNAGNSEVSLAGWSLTDDAEELRQWMFPTNTTIPAGGYLLVLATGLDSGPTGGATYLHTNFRLESHGEYLGLINAEGLVVSELRHAYLPQDYLHSQGRDTNGRWGFLSMATPGGPNVGTALSPAPAAPSFSVVGGFHAGTVSLVLATSTAGASVHYTLDGSEPNPGTPYTGPILLTTNAIVRARSVQAGALPSPTITHTYLLNQSAARKSLPALCLGGDPVLTYYGPNASGGPANGEGIFAIKGGIYVSNVWTHNSNPSAFNYPMLRGRAAEKPATLEYYPLSGEPLRTDFGVRISGSRHLRPRYLLTDPASSRFTPTTGTQKPSFNLFFRSEWGERPLEYPFFGNSPVTRFTDLRIRAGKNDVSNPFIRDELMRRIYLGTGQKSSLGTFNTVYLNGVFKGYFNLCERLREGFMQEHYYSAEPWDVNHINEFVEGDPMHWNKMIAFVRSNNFANNAAFAQVHDYLDVDNFIDYLLVNTYAAMWDWPHNNWVAARERAPQGRWRFYVWDAEGAFGVQGRTTDYNSFTNDLIRTDALTTTSRYIAAIYTLLRASPEFRLRFADRAQRHLFNGGCLVKTNLQTLYLQLRNAINPIMLETIGATVNESFYNTWIATDTRRDVFLLQLRQHGHWPFTIAPEFSHYGGEIGTNFVLTLTNLNGRGEIYFTTDGTDPRAPGGVVAGQVYTGPITLRQTTRVQARVRNATGEWSPVIDALFTVPPPAPAFLPGGSADWTTNANWSSHPAPYPNGPGQTAIIPPPAGAERNVNLDAPVTIGRLIFPQDHSTVRNRVRDQNTGNTFTFHHTNGPARIEVGGTTNGHVEFEVVAGAILQSDLQLHVTNLFGHPEHGALRLRESWSGAGGLLKSGLGAASLTGESKSYTGATIIEEGVLLVTQPATPTATALVSVQPGGQLRLISANDPGGPRTYTFGGPLSLAGFGRGSEIPEENAFGRLGALRYDPGSQDNQAIVTNPILLAEPADIHVDGARNTLELGGVLSGPQPVTKTGGGTLRLSADNATYVHPFEIENGALELAGPLGSPVTLASLGTLKGYGRAGALSGNGTVWLDQTLLRAPAATGLTNASVFGKTGSPWYGQPAAAGNGVLVLDSAPVSPQALDLYLSVPTPSPSDKFRGGFFVPWGANLAAALAATTGRVFIPDAQGGHAFAGQSWSQLAHAQITTVPESADVGQGLVPGRTLEVRLDGAPTTFAAWQALAFPDPADRANPLVSGPAADPQGSGVANLLRYALGLTLTEDPSSRAPQYVGSPSDSAIQFPFDAGRNDLVYLVEAASSVTGWSSGTILFDSRTDFPTGSDAGWIIIHDPAPPGEQRFYRLRVFLVANS